MTIELIKQLLDACYLAKRAREMLPALPEGVTSSYIQRYTEPAPPRCDPYRKRDGAQRVSEKTGIR